MKLEFKIFPFRLPAIMLALALSAMAAGCGTSDFGDHDADIDWIEEELPVGSVHFYDDNDTTLSHRELGVIKGFYLNPHGAPAQTTVTLSLLGNAYDTTLPATRVESLAGDFEATIIAGSVNTDFTLRAVAEDGARSEISIKITSSDHGIIKINPLYEGRRRIDYYDVLLYEHDEQVSCPIISGEPSFVVFQNPPELFPFTFSHLPEDASFSAAIYGFIFDEDGSPYGYFIWVEGCKENIPTELDSATTVNVYISDDREYFSHEAFATHSIIDAGEILESRVETIFEPLLYYSTSADEIAVLLLDKIQNRFDEPNDDIFSNARQESGMDQQVTFVLLSSGAGDLEKEIENMTNLLSISTGNLEITGRLEKDFWPDPEEEVQAKHVLESISAVDQNIVGELLSDETRESVLTISYDCDMATLGAHSFPIGAGSLLLEIANRIGMPSTTVDIDPSLKPLAQWLLGFITCETIARRLAGNEDMAALTSPDNPVEWYESACLEILSETVEAIEAAVLEIDYALPYIELSGTADFLESDGSPRHERTAEGTWNELKWGSETFSAPQSFTLEPSVSLE